MHLVPAYVVVMAIFILGEPLQLFHIVGIAVIAIGIYASTISGRISEHKR